ncbi:MAG: CCA tRNA nucleotidyltransferase [Alphaproteobacteria bacterium]|nr:CCA tRNA nucleotidyltransferase [Alphaproteobacteria bacterium]
MSLTLSPDWLHWPETQALVRAFKAAPGDVRFVGGCVRDAVLGRSAEDIDLATTHKPEQVMALLKAAGITVIPTGLKHGTVTAAINRRRFEITTLRRDTACDGRHAEVAFTDDWEADAKRRDFTMNALFLTSGGELFDYTDGAGDAKAGRVRFIGDAGERVREDYLRILRFFRFFAQYGRHAPDTQALAACRAHAEGLDQISGERIQHEMFKLLAADNPLYALCLMRDCGILARLIPETHGMPALERLPEMEQTLRAQAEPETKLALLLPPEQLEAVAARWKLANATREIIARLHHWLPQMESLTGDVCAQKKTLRALGITPYTQLALMAAAGAEDAAHYADMLKLADGWSPPEFPVTGHDLLAMGKEENAELGRDLKKLEALWEESDYKLSRGELLKLL